KRGHAGITHALLYIGDCSTAEYSPSGGGLYSRPLFDRQESAEFKAHSFDIFRFKGDRDKIAATPAEVASAFLNRKAQEKEFGGYAYKGAGVKFVRTTKLSWFGKRRLTSKMPTGQSTDGLSVAHLNKNLKFYCSSFVVFAYNYAAMLTYGQTASS